jgi:UDP-N-acetylglucosamine--N-acetylmuramyl-(pentapeptide) pyrophosphoryl-undecaprenol N-acetylglucosamine transferase
MSGAFVLAAGGTGGHLFPAEALARELLGRGRTVHLVTDSRAEGWGERVPGVMLHRVHAGRLGGGPAAAARGLAALAFGIWQARGLLRRLMPAGVVGFGGYASLPAMLAAHSLGLPAMIHEQNAVLGRANRLIAARARQIATGFAATARLRAADCARAVHTGNPVRPAILAAAERGYMPPAEGQPIEILVLGGSQGAHVLGEVVPAALAALPEALRGRLRVGQQARPEDRAAVIEQYRQRGIAAEVESFFDDVPERLARAQLAICRAGASTIAELGAIGRPALLIPYPYATDDHQSANARAFAAAGGGWALPQSEASAAVLAARLERLFADPAQLGTAAAAARHFGRRDAGERLARLALALAPAALPQECAA